MLPDRVIVIQPKNWTLSSKYTHSVFVKGLLPSSVTFKHNHYVPLIYGDVARKRKSSSPFPRSMKPCNFQFAWKHLHGNKNVLPKPALLSANVSKAVPTFR